MPLQIKANIPRFGDRSVIYQKDKLKIRDNQLFVEVSFLKASCYIVAIDIRAKYQILELPAKIAKSIVYQKREDIQLKARA